MLWYRQVGYAARQTQPQLGLTAGAEPVVFDREGQD
jgi:hypothetical protein